jgi:hypothetical protein
MEGEMLKGHLDMIVLVALSSGASTWLCGDPRDPAPQRRVPEMSIYHNEQ